MGYFLVQYKTKRCSSWIIGNVRGTSQRAEAKAEDWLRVSCVTESRVLEIKTQE